MGLEECSTTWEKADIIIPPDKIATFESETKTVFSDSTIPMMEQKIHTLTATMENKNSISHPRPIIENNTGLVT